MRRWRLLAAAGGTVLAGVVATVVALTSTTFTNTAAGQTAAAAPATTRPPSSAAATARSSATLPASSSPTPAKATKAPTTPLAINGQLHVCGVHLCNAHDKAIQLRGVSTHGLQFAPNCYPNAALDALADDWHSDLLRIAMYVQEGGFETDRAGFTAKVNTLVDKAAARGMYAIVDFHILNPGDPAFNLARAKTFFASVAKRNAAKKNVLYEIANEPNGVSWAAIKAYAEKVVPVIRAQDPDAVVIVGTRGFSSLGIAEGSSSAETIADPIKLPNVMYAFHFYAASHKDNYRAEITKAAAKLPVFVTEFGTVTFTGNGAFDPASTTTWLDLLDRLKISYANWTFSDINESSAALKPGTCASGKFAGAGVLTASGKLIRSRLRAG